MCAPAFSTPSQWEEPPLLRFLHPNPFLLSTFKQKQRQRSAALPLFLLGLLQTQQALFDYIWNTPMIPAANTVMMLRIHR